MQNDLKSQLLGNYGLWHTPWWQTQWFYALLIALGVLMVLALCVGIFFFVRARMRQLTPWAHAYKQLKELQSIPSSESKKFYSLLTHILKEYISERYATDMRGKTDQEVVLFLHQAEISHLVKHYFEEIVRGGMYSKFANQQAVKEQMEHNLKQAYSIIQETIPADK